MASPSSKSSYEVPLSFRGIWNVVAVTADPPTRRELQQTFCRLAIDVSWFSMVNECRKISRRDAIDMVFSDERVTDGDYWDVYGAITRGLITKPKIVLIPRSMTRTECQQAQHCGIFAVLERPFRPAMIESMVISAKRSTSDAKAASSTTVPKFDIFAGAPERDAVWICAVQGLPKAKAKMEQIGAEKPGRYFIFYAPERNILSEIETIPSTAKQQPEASAVAAGAVAAEEISHAL